MSAAINFSHLDDESLPIAAVEHNGRIAFANSALEALLGVPHKQIEGEWQLVHTKAPTHPAADQNEVNKELLRNLAHEIKNPLGGIRGAAQLLQMDMTDKSLIEYTQVIIHEADRLQSLVDRLLAPHRQPHVLGTVNVHEICERVRQLILVEFPHGLTVVRDYDASIPEFQGDREQLIQALLNIAHNAAQALEDKIADGSATLTFKTRIARQVVLGNGSNKTRHKLALQLHVIDNGPGVPDEIKDRIFYPLVTGRAGGSGLGLSLAQNFVQQHGGVIECESRPGLTDFKILLPLVAT